MCLIWFHYVCRFLHFYSVFIVIACPSLFFIFLIFFFFLSFFCVPVAGSLEFREMLVRMWHASIQDSKEIFPIQADPRPSIWFCLVKARRDWNSPIKINLKLIMAWSEGPDSSCLCALADSTFFCPQYFDSGCLLAREKEWSEYMSAV